VSTRCWPSSKSSEISVAAPLVPKAPLAIRMRASNNTIMNVPIPPEFEAFARPQVAAGRYASEAEGRGGGAEAVSCGP
jgi:hypothetical protein